MELTNELIAERAYARWQQRGCPHGSDTEDWLAARAELEREMAEAEARFIEHCRAVERAARDRSSDTPPDPRLRPRSRAGRATP